MSLFNCIPNQCARVVWQPYEKGGGVRYRYPGKDWITVDGDDFTIDDNRGQCYVGYTIQVTIDVERARVEAKRINGEWVLKWIEFSTFTDTFNFSIHPGYKINSLPELIERDFPFHGSTTPSRKEIVAYRYSQINEAGNIQTFTGTTSQIYDQLSGSYWTHFFVPGTLNIKSITPLNPEPPECAGECKFTVTKDGEIVHEESRDECPEVEILDEDDCQLSENTQEILIDKLGYLERVEVRNQAIDSGYIGAAPYLIARDIPDNTLIIYRALVTAPLGLSEYVPLPGFVNPWQEIARIESDPDCPPPEYQVLCDCDCESCPDGTCAIICDDHICCNDPTTGKNISSISLENYCEI